MVIKIVCAIVLFVGLSDDNIKKNEKFNHAGKKEA